MPTRLSITCPPRARSLAGIVALLATLIVAPAHAQVVKPWVPAGDSLLRDVTTARMRFQHQQGDSVGGDNYGAFEIVGRLGRKMLQSLGRDHLLQAPAVAGALDSLGLDVEVVNDPKIPSIVLLLARNPFRRTSDAVGFLYWFRQSDLRMQGAVYPPSRDVSLRAWWTARAEAPYEAAVLYRPGNEGVKPGFKLFRMSPDGFFWNMTQYEGHSPEMGARAMGSFADVNLDGVPELLVFNEVDPDTFFTIVSGAPKLMNEFIYTERPEGFVLHDARTLPGPSQTLRLFAEMMADRQYERAKKLLLKPEKVTEAVANGWAGVRGKATWTVEYGEAGQSWPEWVEVRIRNAAGVKRWIFHFFIQDGRWVIHDWIPVQAATPTAAPTPRPAARDSVRMPRR